MEDLTKLNDLGHDDVDGQEGKDGRSRTWMLLLYEDDPTHKAVLEGKLAELDWNFAGRIHDKDDGVKPHYHVVALFKDGRKKFDIAKDLEIDVRFLRAWDRKKKALRYLCHRDNPEKYQYSTDGIFGTIAEQAVSACSKGNELSEAQAVKEITEILDSIDGFVSYKFFLALMADKGLYPVFRRLGIIGTRLLDEHNGIQRAKLDRELRADYQREKFIKFFKSLDELPFDKRVELMEKYGYTALPMNDD